MTKPLTGLKVLDFSRVVAGPFATRMLSDLGADVVKVEPPEGDLTRAWGKRVAGLSSFYVQQNAGKRNLSADLKAEGAPDLMLRLIGEADIVVENYRPGVMAKLGLGYETMRAANRSIIVLSISGFGQTSSWSQRAAYAPIVHAESGFLARQAAADRAQPSDPILSIADTNASLHGLVAVLAALRYRDQTGEGQHIDLAMLSSMTATDDYAHFVINGDPTMRLGGIVWQTGFGPIITSGNEKSLWYQISRAGLATDGLDADATVETKVTRRRSVMAELIGSHPSLGSLVEMFDRANIAWAVVRPPDEVFSTAVAAELELTTPIDDRAGGTRLVQNNPYRFSSLEASVAGPAPFRGEHNREILRDWLGSDEIPDGILSSEVRP